MHFCLGLRSSFECLHWLQSEDRRFLSVPGPSGGVHRDLKLKLDVQGGRKWWVSTSEEK